MKRKLLVAVIVLCASMMQFARGAEFEMKFSVPLPEGHHLTLGIQEFGKLLGEMSNGRIVAHTYPGGQLATGERESVEGLQFGTIDATIVSVGSMPIYDKDFMMFAFPYLFRDEENAWAAVDGDDIGPALAKKLADQGVLIAGWGMSGSHTMTSHKPINSMADLKGLKIRCMENPLIIDAWKAYGAVPTPMSIGEVFTALQQGTVDAQDNGTANTYANKYYEVTKYLAMTEHLIQPCMLLVSKMTYDSLPADLRKIMDEAGRKAAQFQREEYLRQNSAAVENMKARGMIVTYPDKEDFKKAAVAVYDKYLPEMSAEVRKWVEDIRTKY